MHMHTRMHMHMHMHMHTHMHVHMHMHMHMHMHVHMHLVPNSLIWQLESSKKMLTVEEAGKLNARPKLLEDLAAMEADSAGWFS